MSHSTPPDGWFAFGSHANFPWINLEFSSEIGEDGLALWERPVPPNKGHIYITQQMIIKGTQAFYQEASRIAGPGVYPTWKELGPYGQKSLMRQFIDGIIGGFNEQYGLIIESIEEL